MKDGRIYTAERVGMDEVGIYFLFSTSVVVFLCAPLTRSVIRLEGCARGVFYHREDEN